MDTMKIRKIYVEEDELVEIHVVPKGESHDAAGFRERLYPAQHKYLLRFGSNHIDNPVVGPFGFSQCGKSWRQPL